MTADVIALCYSQPDREAVLAALLAAGPDLGVRPDPSGAFVRLLDRHDRPMLAIEGPLLVQVDGEVERLLGLTDVRTPVWWMEIRAVSGRPGAAEAARRFADRLVGDLGGAVWRG